MPRAKKDPQRCKALDADTGCRCVQPADDTGYCEAHRYQAIKERLGLPKHQIYARYFTAGEVRELLEAEQGPITDLSWEIVTARVTVTRALKLWLEQQAGVEAPVHQKTQVLEKGGKGQRATQTTVRQYPDFWAVVDRVLGRVGHLVEQQARVAEVKDLAAELDQLRATVLEAKKKGPERPKRRTWPATADEESSDG